MGHTPCLWFFNSLTLWNSHSETNTLSLCFAIPKTRAARSMYEHISSSVLFLSWIICLLTFVFQASRTVSDHGKLLMNSGWHKGGGGGEWWITVVASRLPHWWFWFSSHLNKKTCVGFIELQIILHRPWTCLLQSAWGFLLVKAFHILVLLSLFLYSVILECI